MPNENRRGGRKQRRGEASNSVQQPSSIQPQHRFEPLRAVSEDELESIHQASLKVLSETGIAFLDETACQQLADAGAVVKVTDAVLTVYSLMSSPCQPQTNSLFPSLLKQKPLGLVS